MRLKKYRGMGSLEAMEKQGAGYAAMERYFHQVPAAEILEMQKESVKTLVFSGG